MNLLCANMAADFATIALLLYGSSNTVKTKSLWILLLGTFAFAGSAPAAQVCPTAPLFLGKSMANAKRAMAKAFGSGWSVNNIGCSDSYVNLMTDNRRADCQFEGKAALQRFLVFGFEGSKQVLGLTYILSGDDPANRNIEAVFPGQTFLPTNEVPRLLAHILAPASGERLYVQHNGKYFIRISADPSQDEAASLVQVFDLRALESQKTQLERCAKEGLFWRE
jgi:hypothetical protein